MQKIVASALGAVAIVALSAPAFAADIPTKGPIYKAAPMFNWTGWYGGVNAGYGWDPNYMFFGQVDVPLTIEPQGGFGGLQLGYNLQISPIWLIGIEADFQFADIRDSDSFSNPPGGVDFLQASVSIKQFGTVRGRFGYVSDRTLVFVTGGLAYAKFKGNIYIDYDTDVGSASQSKWLAGYVVGAGIERAFGNNWTLKIEYLFMDFATLTITGIDDGGTPFSLVGEPQLHVVRLGLNRKFSTMP